jgi:hypothetical protein
VQKRGAEAVADRIEVANDVKTVFRGRVAGSDESSVSVYQKDMGTVTLRLTDQTGFGELFLAKPFVRKPVPVHADDLVVGSLIEVHNSKADALAASFVELARSEGVSTSAELNPVRIVR